jgi:hypothetical protein
VEAEKLAKRQQREADMEEEKHIEKEAVLAAEKVELQQLVDKAKKLEGKDSELADAKAMAKLKDLELKMKQKEHQVMLEQKARDKEQKEREAVHAAERLLLKTQEAAQQEKERVKKEKNAALENEAATAAEKERGVVAAMEATRLQGVEAK